jgi:glycosyltransferase involved in cell wall biosynthesis
VQVADWATAQLVLSEHDMSALPDSPPITVVPNVMFRRTSVAAERDIDLVFTGNMRYPPNLHAARWLDREIVPALWARRPGARVVVAGRGAARISVKNAEVMSDVPSIPELLARSRVAIAPLGDLGTGVPNKVLEAASCGAALVVTPWVEARLPLPARVAEGADALAREVAALLEDPRARGRLAEEAQEALEAFALDRVADRLDVVLDDTLAQRRT